MSTKSDRNMNKQRVNHIQPSFVDSANDPDIEKIIQNEPVNSRQITYKIKDGLYLATSLDAFKDDEFILLNWIQHIVVLENEQDPFDNLLKAMYGQENDQFADEDQEVIKYLHFNQNIFMNDDLQSKFTEEEASDQKLDESLIRQLHHPQNDNKLITSFPTIFQFIQESQSFGSSCLIMPSNKNEQISTLSGVFSVCTAYLMKKYKWSLYKALEFMNSRLKDVDLTDLTYEWLNKVEISLLKHYTLTYNWQSYQSSEELVLRNTFLNSRKIVCDNTLKKLQINGQTTSRQRLKSRSKFENPSKKLNLTNRNYQPSQSEAKPILKELNFSQNIKTQRKRLQINTSLNQVKQYTINTQEFDQQQVAYNFLSKNQVDKQQSFESSKSQSFLSASRNKRISLCVSKIVSKYRQQRNFSQRNRHKNNSFDKVNDTTFRGMTKKKSLYNFESVKTINNQQTKQFKSAENEQISKILKKIKIKQKLDEKNDNEATSMISHTQPSICILSQNDKETKLKTESAEEIVSEKEEIIKSSTNTIKNSINAKQSYIQPSLNLWALRQDQPTIYRSQEKLRQLRHSNSIKNRPRQRPDVKKQNSIDRLNGNTRVYIKDVKTQKMSERKQSIKENIDNAKKYKEKNLMIEYEDFKEMIKKRQKSICNLVQNHTEEENVLKVKTASCLTSVIQKLKKDVSEIQLGINQSHIMKKSEHNIQKNVNLKNPTLKWR